MSKIQEILAAATEVEPSKRKNETATSPDYMKRLAVAVGELSDEEWKKLPREAQDWYNEAADAIDKKSDIPAFPDDAKEEPATRRRGAAAAKDEPYKPAAGDEVELTNKRGKTYTGTIAEVDEDGLVLSTSTGDVDFDHDKITEIKLVAKGAAGGGEEAAAADDGPGDPAVGDTVELVTKRDKVYMGNVIEIDDDTIVIKTAAGEEHDFEKEKLKSLVVKVKNAGGGKASKADKPAAKAEKEEAPAKDDAKKKITAKDNGGVSATMRMRELICADPEAKKDVIGDRLKKEGLEFKQATLDLIYSDTTKIIGILRDLKKLK